MAAGMATMIARGLVDMARGVGSAVRRRPGTLGGAAGGLFALSILLPPLVLSVARKPVDYFTINPWLTQLPDYLRSEVPRAQKLARLPDLALFWFSADSPFGGTDWGFAVDVRDLGRLLLTALLFGLWAALWRVWRAGPVTTSWPAAGRSGGVAGALVGVVGLSTGPCSVMGCGAPVLPVLGLAFAGLSSTTVAMLSQLSRVAGVALLVGLAAAVAVLGWSVGRRARAQGYNRP